MLLIGIGEELSAYRTEQKEEVSCFAESLACSQKLLDSPVREFYKKLAELVGDKPYFIISMNTDDLIYKIDGLDCTKIVTPCGSMLKYQCGEHILDEKESLDICREVTEKKDPSLAVCPICHKELRPHLISWEGYLEEGYLPQWQAYTKWLSRTLNRKLCVLELGVSFRFPQVIRWPFEKTVLYNKKATLIRVHSQFPQIPDNIADKAIAVKENPLSWL